MENFAQNDSRAGLLQSDMNGKFISETNRILGEELPFPSRDSKNSDKSSRVSWKCSFGQFGGLVQEGGWNELGDCVPLLSDPP